MTRWPKTPSGVGIRELERVEVVQMGPGKPAPGAPGWTVWEQIERCDVRLAKGQANAECFDGEPDFFLLFMVKCEMVVKALTDKTAAKICLGDLVLAHTGS